MSPRTTWTKVKLTRLPRQHVIRDASTSSTTANDRHENENREVAPISIRSCRVQDRTDRPKQRTGIPDERFPDLGWVPFGEPVLFAALFSDHKKQKRTQPLLTGERLAFTHALPSTHGVWPSGPVKKETRFFHVSNKHPFAVHILNASEHVLCFDFSCSSCSGRMCFLDGVVQLRTRRAATDRLVMSST